MKRNWGVFSDFGFLLVLGFRCRFRGFCSDFRFFFLDLGFRCKIYGGSSFFWIQVVGPEGSCDFAGSETLNPKL